MDNILIELNIDKEPYIKELSKEKIINLTGESGSGKSYYSKKYMDDEDYIVVDTDEIFSRFEKSNGINRELGIMFRNKYNELPDICKDFDLIYKDILEYFKDSDKTIVIDSAQFRNIKDYSLLKGKVIIMRTCIDTCYQRCINRYKQTHQSYNADELNNYCQKKKKMYIWYESLNEFIQRIDKI